MLSSPGLMATLLLVLATGASAWSWPFTWGQANDNNWSTSVEAFAAREYFYIGGSYVNTTTGHLFANQMYVEKLIPNKSSKPYPLVFIHGQAQTGTVSSVNVDAKNNVTN